MAQIPGRMELLGWMNSILETNYYKVEDLGDGVAFCQLVDAIRPTEMRLDKVVWKCINEDQRLKNLRMLENTLGKIGVKKVLPVERMAKLRFQENLSMLQWFYGYVRNMYGDSEIAYDGKARRAEAQTSMHPPKVSRVLSGRRLATKKAPVKEQEQKEATEDPQDEVEARKDTYHRQQLEMMFPLLEGELKQQLRHQQESALEIEQLQREREFYFSKLRDMETCVDKNRRSRVGKQIRNILLRTPIDFEDV